MSEQQPVYTRVEETSSVESGGQQPSKRPRSKWVALCVSIGILVVIALIAFFGLDGSGGVASQRNANNVEVIDISGTIEEAGDTYNQDFIEKRIATAKNDPNNIAIMLLINSTGGAVYESDETYLKLMDYKEETGRPIYAYCEDYCASGGYYIASAADEIVANRNSFVGSIGVICGQIVDASELLNKLGIDITTVHSGANKLMGSSYEPPTEEQIAIYQTLSDEIYERFVGIVADSRGMSVDAVKTLADGRIYSASQSKNNGLIDNIMTQDEFDEHLRELLGDDITFYHETYQQSGVSKLFNLASNAISAVRAGSSELSASLEALDELTYNEPMLIYQP